MPAANAAGIQPARRRRHGSVRSVNGSLTTGVLEDLILGGVRGEKRHESKFSAWIRSGDHSAFVVPWSTLGAPPIRGELRAASLSGFFGDHQNNLQLYPEKLGRQSRLFRQ